MRTAAFLILLAGPVLADGCPVAPDLSDMEPLYDALQQAADENAARPVTSKMWARWLTAPDFPSQTMLDEGLRARDVHDYARALDRFTALVSYCPFYAEGYNQRGFVHYLRGEHEAALSEIEQALALNPRHVGALSGKGLVLMALGRTAEGRAALRDAVALNPWLAERHLLR